MASNPHYEGINTGAIQKEDNGKLIKVFPQALSIVWGKDRRYWKLPDQEKLGEPATLLQVCWLEVTGSVDIDPRKGYEVRFKVSLTADAFGWSGVPIFVMTKRGKDGKSATWKKVSIDDRDQNQFFVRGKLSSGKTTAAAGDDDDDTKLYFGLYEVWSGRWKGGLKIHHVEIQEID